jgi:hypothetical protein
VHRVVERARGAARTIVIDEVSHGYGQPPSFWRSLFAFPLVLIPLHLILLLFAVLWAGGGRFGAPLRDGDGQPAGKEGLIANIAALLRLGRHDRHLVVRYLQGARRDVEQRLRVPPDLAPPRAVAWLDAQAEARGVASRLAALEADVVDTSRSAAASTLVVLARRIHQWREEMIRGSGFRT